MELVMAVIVNEIACCCHLLMAAVVVNEIACCCHHRLPPRPPRLISWNCSRVISPLCSCSASLLMSTLRAAASRLEPGFFIKWPVDGRAESLTSSPRTLRRFMKRGRVRQRKGQGSGAEQTRAGARSPWVVEDLHRSGSPGIIRLQHLDQECPGRRAYVLPALLHKIELEILLEVLILVNLCSNGSQGVSDAKGGCGG